MIKSFMHKGLEKFYSSGNTKGIQVKHATKLRMQLAALDTAHRIEDLDIPGYSPNHRGSPDVHFTDFFFSVSGLYLSP